jgi:SAM-dependent methyltransferase
MVFGDYSNYYNLLYRDKDYLGEARYVHEMIRKHHPGAETILNLGCGTGNHDFELAKLGYRITGVDLSNEMLLTATLRLSSLNPRPSINFLQGDVRTMRLGKTFDVIISLFHVMSYQTTNEDLRAILATFKAHLNPGGMFLFDCWYGPAVLSDPPVVRIKRLGDGKKNVLRIAEPVIHYNENVVDVNYQIVITEKATGTVQQFTEVHRMRYLFIPEMTGFLDAEGLKIVQIEELGTGKDPGNDTWGVCFVGCLPTV